MNLTGCLILATFSPHPNHKNSQQHNFNVLWHRRSRSRGVAKINFGTPMLHGKHFFLWSAPSVGARFLHFATPPQREGDFFHFFDTSPARIKKMNKIALRSYGFDASARKSPKANRQQIVILLRQVRSGRVFQIAKNWQIESRMCAISKGYQ